MNFRWNLDYDVECGVCGLSERGYRIVMNALRAYTTNNGDTVDRYHQILPYPHSCLRCSLVTLRPESVSGCWLDLDPVSLHVGYHRLPHGLRSGESFPIPIVSCRQVAIVQYLEVQLAASYNRPRR